MNSPTAHSSHPLSLLIKLLVVVVVVAALWVYARSDASQWLSLASLKAHAAGLASWRVDQPWAAAATFFVVYVLVTAVSLPGAVWLWWCAVWPVARFVVGVVCFNHGGHTGDVGCAVCLG